MKMLPFPFSKGGLPKWLNQAYFNNDIQKFVQNVVEQSISSSLKHTNMMDIIDPVNEDEQEERSQERSQEQSDQHVSKKDQLDTTIFESHDHVYVKVFINDVNAIAHLKIFHNSNRLIIEGIPSKEDRHEIALPSIVKMKESISEYRDNYLQIKMRKKIDPQYTEIAVPPLE